MVRRPHLLAAVVLAGLLWLGVFPAAPPWEQGCSAAPSALPNLLTSSAALAAEAKPPPPPASTTSPVTGAAPAEAARNPLDNLIRFLAGGLLAGVLWSALFGYPFSSYWPDRPSPLGLLDLSVLAVFCYLGYVAVKTALHRNHGPPAPSCPSFLRCRTAAPLTVTVAPEAEPGLRDIAASDPTFALAAFGEFARQVMANLHNAWNQQDLAALTDEVGGEVLDYLRMGLKMMNLREEISRLEDLHLTRLEVTAAGREDDRDFIALKVEGQVMDYILQKSSYKLVSGSLTYPAEVRESWRFERRCYPGSWKLTDIQDY
jgi:predicted lipid-binding transport protein (Tim44 family)